MKIRDYFILAGLGWLVACSWALMQRTPGYMDAAYYFTTGKQIAIGAGLQEPYIWNFLGDPTGLPQPAYGYWMPLAGFVAAFGMTSLNSTAFWAAQGGFVLMSGLVPPITARLAASLGEEGNVKPVICWMAGLLAIFNGLYAPFMTTSDTFGLYMLFGSGIILILSQIKQRGSAVLYLLLGVFTGCLHLSRADGGLWLGIAILFVVFRDPRRKSGERWEQLVILLAGYGLVMGPWMARNWLVLGAPLAPGGSRMLWLTEYNELYTYHPNELTFERWWTQGLVKLAQDRLMSLSQNLQTLIAVQGMIFGFPLVLVGIWQKREYSQTRWGMFGWLVTFVVMTLIFPFAGARGGYFHSGAATQPLMWGLMAYGFDAFVIWGRSKRDWQPDQAWRILGGGLLVVAGMITVVIGMRQLPSWNEAWDKYRQLDIYLAKRNVATSEIVMVNNPPEFYGASGRRAIVIPNGSIKTLTQAALQYNVGYIWVEESYPEDLEELYSEPGNRPGLEYLGVVADSHIYQVER